jgi:hypothetical protein
LAGAELDDGAAVDDLGARRIVSWPDANYPYLT